MASTEAAEAAECPIAVTSRPETANTKITSPAAKARAAAEAEESTGATGLDTSEEEAPGASPSLATAAKISSSNTSRNTRF